MVCLGKSLAAIQGITDFQEMGQSMQKHFYGYFTNVCLFLWHLFFTVTVSVNYQLIGF